LNNLINNKIFVIFLFPFLLGAITILGFAPYNFTFINFLTFPLLLYLIFLVQKKTESKYRKKKSNRYFFYLGCAFGFGYFLLGNYWISISLTHQEDFKSLIPFAIVIIPLFLSLFFGLAILLVGSICEKKISFILLFSLAFSIFEFLRGNILTGFPWNLISYTWSWSAEIIQILSFMGAYSLSLLSVTIFCIPFLFFQKKFVKKNIIFFSIALVVFIGNYLFGFFIIKNGNYKFHEDVYVKIISPNFSLEDYYIKSENEQLKKLIKISDPEYNKKTVFIWPEGIFYESNLEELKKYKKLFSNNFSKKHLIILGINNFINYNNQEKKKYFNSLAVINHNAEILSIYNKISLVPFGEFLPFENILSKLGIKKITRGYTSFSPGETRSLIKLDLQFEESLILPLICYEIIYPGKIKTRKQFPNLIINISEDAWFGRSVGPYQHYTKAVYRSVEEGVFIARSANKGISGFIDPNGKSIKTLNIGESGNIEYKMPQFFQSTPYSQYGNKIFLFIIFLYIFSIFILRKFKI